MKTAKLSLAILIAMTAACTHPGAGMSPTQRETALRLFVDGASTDEIALHMSVDRDDARAAVRAQLRTLMARYRYER